VPRHAYRAPRQRLPSPGESAVKKIEAFIRHQAFEPIRSEPQAHSEEEVAAGAAAEE